LLRISAVATDWAAWLRSWEAQQGALMGSREERFGVIVDAVRVHCGDRPRVLDLGSGPGSLATRIVGAIPGASVIAVDRDPVLLEIGRHALAGDQRISFADRDLGAPDLTELGAGFDAAVSTTALHWLDREGLRHLYRSLAAMLRPDGLFLNGDRHYGDPSPVEELATAVRRARDGDEDAHLPAPLTWEGWWAAVTAAPELAGAVARRRSLGHEHPHHSHPPTLGDHQAALREAGFRDVAPLWRRFDDMVLAAIL
jgi:SAM-dependent methyltransferase